MLKLGDILLFRVFIHHIYHETKTILNESHNIVFFPSTLGGRSLKYLLDSYLGLDKKQIEKVKNLDSRWVCVCKTFPQVILSEKNIMITKLM